MNDEEAKAVKEVAITTRKALESADKAGGFFSRIFGDGIEATFGRWADNKIAERNINRIDLVVKVQAKLEDAGITDIRELPLKIGIPLLESASLEDEPVLKEMWENLLVSAVSDCEVEKHYVKTLDLFTPSNAYLLNYLFPLRYLKNHRLNKFSADDVCRKAGVEEHDIRSLIRFGIVDSTYSEIVYGEGHDNRYGHYDKKMTVSNGLKEFEFTEFGLSFSRCIILESKE